MRNFSKRVYSARMVVPSERVRPPAVAGMFYPAADEQCRTLAKGLISANAAATDARWIGGVVPHAGWICSGAIAGEVIGTIAKQTTPDVVVVFGAVHTPLAVDRAVLASFEKWHVPGGDSPVFSELARDVGASLLSRIADSLRWT